MKIRYWAGIVGAAVAALVLGGEMRNRPVSGPDIFRLEPNPNPIYNGSWGGNAAYTDTNGRTLRSAQSPDLSVSNLVLVIPGQSNAEAEAPTGYTPTNASAIDNFNAQDGALYAWVDPPLGSSYGLAGISGGGPGHIGARIADKFINAGTFARVVVAPIAIGGTTADQWATGGPLADRLPKTLLRLAAKGWYPRTNVTVVILWRQGENPSISGAAYTAALNSVIANARAVGFTRFFVNTQTWAGGAVNATTQAAQAACVNGVDVYAGGNTDTLNNSNRVDTTHLNDTGNAASATLDYNAMHASGAPL